MAIVRYISSMHFRAFSIFNLNERETFSFEIRVNFRILHGFDENQLSK